MSETKTATELSKDEKSLLLYLETRAVDYMGRVDMAHMNDADRAITDKWVKKGLIKFGRIIMADHNSNGTHWVELGNWALEMAHELRAARIGRGLKNRRYTRTEDR